MNTMELNTENEIANANYVLQRKNGVWSAMGSGMNARVMCFMVDADKNLYAGGFFTTADGNAALGIAKWDWVTWAALPDGGLSGGASPACHAIVGMPDGRLFAAGAFTDAGGTAAKGIAMHDGTNWSSIGNLLTGAADPGQGYALAKDPNGNIYVGGLFATAGGVSAVNIAKWDGTTWSALGSGCNNYVTGLLWGIDGNLYASGVFTEAGGVAAVGIAKWDGVDWSPVGGDCAGGSAAGYAIAQRANGEIVLGGSFTSVAGIAANNIAAWNGSTWRALGSGVNAGVQDLGFSPNGNLIVGGVFTIIDDLTIGDRIGVWNWSTWQPLDIDLPGTPTIYAMQTDEDTLYIGFDSAGIALTAGAALSTIENEGTAKTYPKFTISRSGGTTAKLQSIRNLTTGHALLFDWALQDGETISIDLTPGQKTINSTAIGNALNKLLPSSDIGSFCLDPGENEITLYISTTGSPILTALIQWETQFATLDGAAS